MKCICVSLALRIASEDIRGSKWMDCCKQAVKELEHMSRGHPHDWACMDYSTMIPCVRPKNESFPNPKFHTCGKAMPPTPA